MTQMWELQEAINKLSEVVAEALTHGPQVIARSGVQVAVVLSVEAYRQLTGSQQKLSQFFAESPLAEEVELDLRRDTSR